MPLFNTVGLVAFTILCLAASALRFELHTDASPTCFDFEMSEAEATSGKQFTVIYNSNASNPAPLMIKTYAPKDYDKPAVTGVLETGNHVVSRSGKPFHFRVAGFKQMGNALFNVPTQYIHGTYEVCFTRPNVGGSVMGNLLKAHMPPEKLEVTLEVFANERHTQPLHTAMKSQAKSSERGDGYHTDDDHHGRAQTHIKSSMVTKDHKDHHTNQMHEAHANEALMKTYNLNSILVEVTEGVKELRERHERFHSTSESSFSRVWIFSVLTMIAMAFSSYRTYYSTCKTLKDKKLV